ncbi:MAG: hypothetical protein KatS3mg105_1819 [Gemmatales bacterium]|nr:MAG: hypothetical protein KatS3mg105_1819 [Gemmatales bacterium]
MTEKPGWRGRWVELARAIWPWLGPAYLIASGLLLARCLLAYFALWRLLRSSIPAPPDVVDVFDALGRSRNCRLLVAPAVQSPFSCGLIRPTIVLTPELCDPRFRSELRWVFIHELTHIERRDAWTCLLFGIGQAVYFYVPWFWWIRRHVQLCQEYLADAAAAGVSEQAADYAQFLLELRKAPALSVRAVGVSGNTSDLYRRVTMLLQRPYRLEQGCPRWWLASALCALFSVAVVASGFGLQAKPVTEEDSAPPKKEKKDEADQPDKSKKAVHMSVRQAIEKLQQALKNLPADAKPDEMRKTIQQAIEELRRNLPKGPIRIDLDVPKAGFKGIMPPRFDFPKNAMAPWGFPFKPVEFRLGVQVSPPSPVLADQLGLEKGSGLVIHHVMPNSAAAKAGFKPHDVLLQLAGKQVKSDHLEFVELLDSIEGGKEIDAVVLRKGKKETLKVHVPEKPTFGPFWPPFGRRPRFGISGFAPSEDLRAQFNLKKGIGLVIDEVQPGSAAEKAGIQKNDVLLEFAGKPVPSDIERFAHLLDTIDGSKPVDAIILRKGKKQTLKGIQLPPRNTSLPNIRIEAIPFGGKGGKQDGSMVFVFRTDDEVRAERRKGTSRISVHGVIEDGKLKIDKIEVHDGKKADRYKSIDDVPEKHRESVKELIELAEKSGLSMRLENPNLK